MPNMNNAYIVERFENALKKTMKFYCENPNFCREREFQAFIIHKFISGFSNQKTREKAEKLFQLEQKYSKKTEKEFDIVILKKDGKTRLITCEIKRDDRGNPQINMDNLNKLAKENTKNYFVLFGKTVSKLYCNLKNKYGGEDYSSIKIFLAFPKDKQNPKSKLPKQTKDFNKLVCVYAPESFIERLQTERED